MSQQLDIFYPYNRVPSKATNTTIQAHRIGPVYHNTTAKTGEDLEKAQLRAGSETERILALFQRHPSESFAPFEVEAILFPNAGPRHITNTRRSISTLTPEYLTKTDQKRIDPATGEGAFCWRLKLNR